jgi:hypothetical protein
MSVGKVHPSSHMKTKLRRPAGLTVCICMLICFFSFRAPAQSGSTSVVVDLPESAFISPEQYTNSFFGFSLPMPEKNPSIITTYNVMKSNDPHRRVLLSFQLRSVSGDWQPKPKLTFFSIVATNSSATSENAKDAAAGPKKRNVEQIEIGGKEFWKGESEENGPGGNNLTIVYAASIEGYVLQFYITSFDKSETDHLKKDIEAIKFFDPKEARDFAGPDSGRYNPSLPRPTTELPTMRDGGSHE